MNMKKHMVITKIFLLALLFTLPQNKSCAFGGLAGAIQEKVVKPMSEASKHSEIKVAKIEVSEDLDKEEHQRYPYHSAEVISESIDKETGNSIDLIRWPDGTTNIIEFDPNGERLSEMELAMDELESLMLDEEGITQKIKKLPDGSIEISQYDKDGKFISKINMDENDMASISTYDSEKNIKTKNKVNEDGSRTITQVDEDGFVLSEETVSPKKKANQKKIKEPYKLAYGSSTDPKTDITTTSVKNPDGSRTITKTDKDNNVLSKEVFPPKGKGLAKASSYDSKSGKKTTVVQNADGSKSMVKSTTSTDSDGTQHSVAMDDNGNSIKTTITPEGIVTTTKTDIYGNKKETIMKEDGSITSVEKTVDGYTTETSKTVGGEAVIVKKDLDGSVMETITQYDDGTRVHSDKYGNMTEELPVNEDGEIWTIETDKKGNEKVSVKNTMGEVLYTEENRVTPKELGREYYEKVLGGSEWDDLPSSTKTRYAGSERRIRENVELEDLRIAQEGRAEKVAQEERERIKKSHKKLNQDLALIRKEQEEADQMIAVRQAKRDRKLELQESYEKADKLQKQYDKAINKGDKQEAKRIEKLQDEHHDKSMDVLAFTKEEEKEMLRKSKLRQELMEKIYRESRFEAEKADLERIKYDEFKDVALEGGSWLSVGAEQQKDLAKSNRQEDRMLSRTDQKDKIIERMLNNKDLTSEQRDILIDAADMSSLQRIGALEKKAANNRIVAAGYAIDVAMLATGGIGNVAVGVGSQVVGKAVAVKVAAKATARSVAKSLATKKSLKEAITTGVESGVKTGLKVGQKYTDDIVKLANYDLKTAASKKVIEKVVARKTAKKVLAKKLAEGATKEVAEATAKKVGDRVGKKVAKEAGKEISEKGLINTAGSKAGAKLAEKAFGKETGVAVEKALVKQRSVIPKSVKKIFKKKGSEEATKTVAKSVTKKASPTSTKTPKTTGRNTTQESMKKASKTVIKNPTSKTTKSVSKSSKEKASPSAIKQTPKSVAKTSTPKTTNKTKPPIKKQAKKPSEMTPAKRQAHHDALEAKQWEKVKKDPSLMVDEGDDILASLTGKPTELRVGELSKNLTKKEVDALFKSGANLSPKQIQQKADIFRKRIHDAKNARLADKTPTVILDDPIKGVVRGGGKRTGMETVDGTATVILDDPLKGALSGRAKRSGMETVDAVADSIGKKTQTIPPGRLGDETVDVVMDSVGKKTSTIPPGRFADEIPTVILDDPLKGALSGRAKRSGMETVDAVADSIGKKTQTIPPGRLADDTVDVVMDTVGKKTSTIPPGRFADEIPTVILDDPLKGALSGRAKRSGMETVDAVADSIGKKTQTIPSGRLADDTVDVVMDTSRKSTVMPKDNISGMPKSKEFGMPKVKVNSMPKGRLGGMGELAKGHPRGMPDGKAGGIIDLSILSAPDGTLVKDGRPFGVLPSAMKDFQKKINNANLRVVVRPTGDAALALRRAGHPPKHVKIKGKTINNIDVKLGAKPGSQGQAGYFKPKKPKYYDSMEASNRILKRYETQLEKHIKRGTRKPKKPYNYDAMVKDSKVLKRFNQRSKEYLDNARDMRDLVRKGLISIDDGVVVDRGLSNTRLGKDGKLVYDRKGPDGGTGMGFRGDHDLWDITHLDGRHIQTNPKKANYDKGAFERKEALLKELGKGVTEAQHGAHKDWVPTSDRDIGIDRKIRKGHYPGGEALLEITPNQPPRITYEGANMPKKKDWGIQDQVGMPRKNVGGMPPKEVN